jgi:hypothetical protein
MDPDLLREIVKRNVHVPRGRGYLTEISREALDLENNFLISEKFIPKPQKYEDVVATSMEPYWQLPR